MGNDDQWLVYTTTEVGSGYTCLWWRPNRSGYTRFVDEAGRYTHAEAESICKFRGLEIAVPVAKAISVAKMTVSIESLNGTPYEWNQ